jgi:choline/glycine/proline betaine transport protein
VAHAIHRRWRPPSTGLAVEPLIGERMTRGAWVNLIDTTALVGTVFGVATSPGLGVTQMSAGLRSLGFIPGDSPWVEYTKIAVIGASSMGWDRHLSSSQSHTSCAARAIRC